MGFRQKIKLALVTESAHTIIKNTLASTDESETP